MAGRPGHAAGLVVPLVDDRIQHAFFGDREDPEYKEPWNQISNAPRIRQAWHSEMTRFADTAGWVWAVLVAAAIVVPGRSVHAQALEPRSYANTPVGINFVLLGYGYTEGDVGFDASSPVTDAKVHVHAGLLAYARSLDVWGLSGKALAVLPFAEASGSAKVAGQGRDRQVFGLADPLLRVSVNVYGAPALSMADFPTYRQDVIVGVGLQVTVPLGQYDSTKLLNVGTNRWSFKPELGVSKAWGPLTLELIPAITFFTDNDDFLGGKTLEQAPIYSVQGHVIYEFFPAFWAAFDAAYYAGGRTTIDGEKGERLENVRLGLTAALSLSRHQSIKLYGSTGVALVPLNRKNQYVHWFASFAPAQHNQPSTRSPLKLSPAK